VPVWQRRYLTVCAAVIGYCIGYVLCDFASWPRLTYAPLDHAFRMTESPGPLESNYIGIVLWGVSGALLAGGIVAVATKYVRRPLSATWNNLAAAWAFTAFGYAGLYYTWGLWPF
jgi:hypothetical protein